ncbi:hypothetical protein ACFWVP_10610 [Streptomyces sp. NPDC058637]|uniref:hypothetical protein n=1 Tax=Streptomyces sp. NPDC058637 TaxID=3346569 RepID=UPI00366530B4
MLDYRLVQTAVIGDKNSDLPVILPMDPHELDFWRKAHPTHTYWCGLQLDGCGGELSDRRYTNKVCHFAHHPSAPTCSRTANGESSADHLFIKQGVRRLLDKRKLRGEVRTRDLGTGPGDAVDVHLAGSRRRLRFQLSTFEYRAWRRAADELAADGSDVDWVLASDGPVTQQIVSRHGYCLRVRCETVGGERRVHIGAEARDRTVAWTPLEDCALTPSGIVTPRVEEIRLTRPQPMPIAFPVQGGVVFALVPEATTHEASPFSTKGRQLFTADVKPVDSPVVRTVISLPGDTDAPPPDHVYRASEGARILLHESGGDWALEANRYVRLNAHDAQRTGLWTPPPGDRAEQRVTPVPEPRTTRAGADDAVVPSTRTAPSKPPEAVPVTRGPLARPDLVTALRDALAQRARLRSTATWETLVRTVGPELATYAAGDRTALLVDVDRPLREHVPVLSALIRQDGAPLPDLSEVLSGLGVPHAEASSHIRRWAAVETDRAFAAHGTPARSMPPRHELRPERPAVPQRRDHALTGLRPRTAVRRGGTSVIRDTGSVRRVRVLTAQLEQLVPDLGKAARKVASEVVSGAHAWLAYQDGEDLPQQERRKLATQTPEHVVGLLEGALRRAEGDPVLEQHLAPYRAERRRNAEPASAAPIQRVEQPKPPAEGPVDKLARRLVTVAAQRTSIPAPLLDGGRARADLQQRMEALDGNIPHDVPMLSAVVLGVDGGPVTFFRDILKAAGLAVPRTEEALLKVWRREQERAYAAYANPPRELPPRLAPRADGGDIDL